MNLYHATYTEYLPGKEVRATQDCGYYPNVLEELERSRPINGLSRSKCVFATDSIVAAATFLESQNRNNLSPIHVYEVQMDLYCKAPFRIVHEIHNRLENEQPINDIVVEYWAPKHNWVFWEYFGPSFQVISEVDASKILIEKITFKLNYDKDIVQSKSF